MVQINVRYSHETSDELRASRLHCQRERGCWYFVEALTKFYQKLDSQPVREATQRALGGSELAPWAFTCREGGKVPPGPRRRVQCP